MNQAYWDVRLCFIGGPFGNHCEAGAHIGVEYAATAEEAVAVCREWRKVSEPLTGISVERREGT